VHRAVRGAGWPARPVSAAEATERAVFAADTHLDWINARITRSASVALCTYYDTADDTKLQDHKMRDHAFRDVHQECGRFADAFWTL